MPDFIPLDDAIVDLHDDDQASEPEEEVPISIDDSDSIPSAGSHPGDLLPSDDEVEELSEDSVPDYDADPLR